MTEQVPAAINYCYFYQRFCEHPFAMTCWKKVGQLQMEFQVKKQYNTKLSLFFISYIHLNLLLWVPRVSTLLFTAWHWLPILFHPTFTAAFLKTCQTVKWAIPVCKDLHLTFWGKFFPADLKNNVEDICDFFKRLLTMDSCSNLISFFAAEDCSSVWSKI